MSPRDRYDVSTLPEAQFEPGSRHRVLKNLLGIIRRREMDEIEVWQRPGGENAGGADGAAGGVPIPGFQPDQKESQTKIHCRRTGGDGAQLCPYGRYLQDGSQADSAAAGGIEELFGWGLSASRARAAAVLAPSMALEEITVCRSCLSRASWSRRYLFVVNKEDFFIKIL